MLRFRNHSFELQCFSADLACWTSFCSYIFTEKVIFGRKKCPKWSSRSFVNCLRGLSTTLQQISYKTKPKIYAAFIDLTAAFDTIQRPWLFKMLRNRSNDPQLRNSNIKVLESLYKSTSAHLAEDDKSLKFEILAGVRQGEPKSPSLFNVWGIGWWGFSNNAVQKPA